MVRIELKEEAKEGVEMFDFSQVEGFGVSSKIMFWLGALEINALMPNDFVGYLPILIKKNGLIVWSFREDEKQEDIKKYANLLTCGSNNVIAIVDSSTKTLLRVIPLVDIENGHRIKTTDGYQFVGSNITTSRQMIELKQAVSSSRGLNVHFTEGEQKLMALDAAKKAKEASEKLADLTAAKNNDNAARRAAQGQRRQEILGREKITVFRENGQRILGIPVTKNEWQCLPHKTGVILVAEYKDGSAKGASEAFFVDKCRTMPRKDKLCAVTETMPKKSDEVAPIEMTRQLFQFGETIDEFLLVTGETLELLRTQKVNSGSQFAVIYKDQPPVLVELKGKEVNTLGNLIPLS